MMNRVLVIYTGGTIGMVASDNGYVPEPGFDARLRAALGDRALPVFDLLEFDRLIDSASVVPADWEQIARTLQAKWRDYTGFVVLHGTDTMAYTASALSFMLSQLDKPVILTGSQIPLSQLRNDALDNLVTALLLASRTDLAEVCICFNGRLLRGNRSRKVKSSGLDAFDSPNAPWLGKAGIDIELSAERLPPQQVRFEIPAYDPDAVVMLMVYPGMPLRLLKEALAPDAVKGLVLLTYGVGNPPETETGLLDVLARAGARGQVVVNVTQCQQGAVSQGAYATGALLNQVGVVSGLDLTPEAAFTKLHHLIALGLSPDAIRKALGCALRGECTPER
ncbi:asparaginase domain-containing protein [Marinobacterium sp. MBR-109]|jgi:L-asparaginase|uniref:asparaginase domain-containing protein n=1 Tax=Marinobacterium sp. MBR-109 TaxID=3156462 RepID=UPI0033980CF2